MQRALAAGPVRFLSLGPFSLLVHQMWASESVANVTIFNPLADVTGDTFRIPLGRFGSPNEVADAAVFLARNRYATNCILNIDGGLSAI